MANIQQVRYDLASQPTPGFMDYAAQFLSNYIGAKKEKTQYEKDLFKSMASSLASTKQIRPTQAGEQGIKVGGDTVPWAYTAGNAGTTVPVNIGGQTFNMPMETGEDINRYSTVLNREKPDELSPQAAIQTAQMSDAFWSMYKESPDKAVDTVFDIQQRYNKKAAALRGAMQKTPIQVLRKGNKQIHTYDGVNWYDENENLLE